MIDIVTQDESRRVHEFPVSRNKIFLGHAGVTALPRRVAEAMREYVTACEEDAQEFGGVLEVVDATREEAAELIHARAEEIALLGPTSLGLSLFAGGIDWQPGYEVICYQDDYPANVYPWMDLRRKGVTVTFLEPDHLGELTPELVERALTEKTRLVALASCNFLGGYRIDIDAIGKLLHDRGILFSLDAIQTLGAFPTTVEHVDFLSADAHKWMLGPMAIGIVYVAREHFEKLHPVLLGAWNAYSPDFITQDQVELPGTGRRYEPGVLNTPGIYGMRESIKLLREAGIDAIAGRLLDLKKHLVLGLKDLGFQIVAPEQGAHATGITTAGHPSAEIGKLFEELQRQGIVASHRFDRQKRGYLRFSPHFYNTHAELDRVLEVLRGEL